jgi:hypothetical protein
MSRKRNETWAQILAADHEKRHKIIQMRLKKIHGNYV